MKRIFNRAVKIMIPNTESVALKEKIFIHLFLKENALKVKVKSQLKGRISSIITELSNISTYCFPFSSRVLASKEKKFLK